MFGGGRDDGYGHFHPFACFDRLGDQVAYKDAFVTGEIHVAFGALEKLRAETIDTISKATGQKPTVRGKDPTSAVKAEGLIWTTAKSQYLLEYSFTREIKSRNIPFRAEFVRLEVRPAAQKQGLIATSLSSGKKERFHGPAHVKKDEATGDVWLGDVPMVDQGQKGYCVVASTERVMRYYGSDVDANELAQVANSDAAQGTSTLAMRAALKKLAAFDPEFAAKMEVAETIMREDRDVLRKLAAS